MIREIEEFLFTFYKWRLNEVVVIWRSGFLELYREPSSAYSLSIWKIQPKLIQPLLEYFSCLSSQVLEE